MRFLCDSCRAQYMISDDKVGARGVKVRCKKCGYVILVRRTEAMPTPVPEPRAEERAADGASEPTPAANSQPEPLKPAEANGATAILRGIADEEIGAVFDQALAGVDGQVNGNGGLDGMESAAPEPAGEAAGGSFVDPAVARPLLDGGSGDEGAPPSAPAAHEWFVAIDDKQVGPLSLENVKELWNRGELGADSLCWRAGLADWVSLSETAELATVLAPKPPKPVIVAPAPLSPGITGPPTPVESAFTAGRTPRGISLEAAAPTAASSAAEPSSGTWKPAAAALASLMKEEIEVLGTASARPTAVPASADVAASGFLTDLPAPASNGQQGGSASVKSNGAFAPSVAPIALSDPYPSGYSVAASGARRAWIIGLSVAGGALLLALAVVTTMLVVGSRSAPQPVPPAHAPAPAAQVAPPPEQSKPAPATTPPPTAPQAAAPAPSPAPPIATEPSPAAADSEPAIGSRRDRGSRRERKRRSATEEITVPRKVEKAEVATAPPPPVQNTSEDDFDRVFGGADKRKSAIPKAEPKKPASVYVPPAPGSREVPESLGTADIMRVVVDNKPAIKQCVDEQRKRDASLSGKIVMSWTILASGKTGNVSCASDDFKGSYMAQCLAGLIKGWQFPRHKVQGEPINFPFTF